MRFYHRLAFRKASEYLDTNNRATAEVEIQHATLRQESRRRGHVAEHRDRQLLQLREETPGPETKKKRALLRARSRMATKVLRDTL